jgi:hypothetical protein
MARIPRDPPMREASYIWGLVLTYIRGLVPTCQSLGRSLLFSLGRRASR